MLKSDAETIKLRALEPKDIDFLYDLENDMSLWHLSHTQQFFSKHLLKQYIANADKDIYEAKQLRLAICNIKNNALIGFIDLFDFDPKNRRAGVGIIIKKQKERNQGYGEAALQLIIDFAFNILHLHQIYANISADNLPSLQLFEKLGFELVGKKKEWNYDGENYKDEFLYQKIK